MSLQLSHGSKAVAERKRAALKAGKSIAEWVFLTPEGTVVDGDNLRNRIFYRLLENAWSDRSDSTICGTRTRVS
jgi:hypothetical protein